MSPDLDSVTEPGAWLCAQRLEHRRQPVGAVPAACTRAPWQLIAHHSSSQAFWARGFSHTISDREQCSHPGGEYPCVILWLTSCVTHLILGQPSRGGKGSLIRKRSSCPGGRCLYFIKGHCLDPSLFPIFSAWLERASNLNAIAERGLLTALPWFEREKLLTPRPPSLWLN